MPLWALTLSGTQRRLTPLPKEDFYSRRVELDLGVSQNKTTRGPHVLVFGSIYQGRPFWVRISDPQPLKHVPPAKNRKIAKRRTSFPPERASLCGAVQWRVNIQVL